MPASVTPFPVRKPNRRRGAIPPSETVTPIAGAATRSRAARFAAAYRRESARQGARPAAGSRP